MNPNQATKHQDEATEKAKLALSLMARHHVPPTPENYAVWFAYVGGQAKALSEEMNRAIKDKRSFDHVFSNFLHQRYIAEDIDKKIVEQARRDAQLLMEHLITVFEQLAQNTSSFNSEVDHSVKDLADHMHSKELKEVAMAVIEKTRQLRSKSQGLTEKLDATSKEVRALKRDLEKLTVESQKDFLTGVDNRKAFDSKLQQLMEEARRNGEPMCVLMLDIDHFKQFNDSYGHPVGDEVLKGVGRLLIESLKGKDVVARYGGEEFAIVLPGTPLAGGLVVGENLRKTIAAKRFIRKGTGEKLEAVTISIGVACLKGEDTANSILIRADDALYRSKKGGRNKVTQESIA